MQMNPEPPFLVIREGKSFWVEKRPVNECSATPQAFQEGCFRDACCYDATGGVWPIVGAELKERLSVAQRLLPWRRVRVEIQLGARCDVDLGNVLSKLALVLRSQSEFTSSLISPPSELLRRFEAARKPSDVIQVASECMA